MKIIKKKHIVSALCVVSSALLTSTVIADDDIVRVTERTNEVVHFESVGVSINHIESSGSGCPAGTVSHTVAPDGKSFILGFDAYIAEAGPGIPRRENRKNCQLSVVLDIPNGYAFTIADVNYRGFASLDKTVEASQASTYFFAGYAQQARLSTRFVGPIIKDYVISDRLALNSLVWSSCNAKEPVVIKTDIRVSNRKDKTQSGLITTDTIDGKLTHNYGLMFRSCS